MRRATRSSLLASSMNAPEILPTGNEDGTSTTPLGHHSPSRLQRLGQLPVPPATYEVITAAGHIHPAPITLAGFARMARIAGMNTAISDAMSSTVIV